MPFVTVLETDDNHDGLIDTFDIQARWAGLGCDRTAAAAGSHSTT